MSDEFITLELARIYESQGYFQDALDMYRTLATKEGGDLEIMAGLQRMESALEKPRESLPDPVLPGLMPEKGINLLLEHWLGLVVLEKKVNFMKQFKSGEWQRSPLG